MNKNIMKRLKHYPFTLLLVAAVWYLSLFTPPKTQLDDVQFIDKWAHLLMYGSLTFVLWWEDSRTRKTLTTWKRATLLFLCPVAMGGLVELAQAYCTTNRSGDWLDFAANTTGCLIGLGIGRAIEHLKKGRQHPR